MTLAKKSPGLQSLRIGIVGLCIALCGCTECGSSDLVSIASEEKAQSSRGESTQNLVHLLGRTADSAMSFPSCELVFTNAFISHLEPSPQAKNLHRRRGEAESHWMAICLTNSCGLVLRILLYQDRPAMAWPGVKQAMATELGILISDEVAGKSVSLMHAKALPSSTQQLDGAEVFAHVSVWFDLASFEEMTGPRSNKKVRCIELYYPPALKRGRTQ